MTADLLLAALRERGNCPDFTLRQWELLLGQARRSALISRLAAHFADHGWLDRVPSQPRRYLDSAGLLASRQRLETRWEVNRIERALRQVDTPIVLLKGAAYVLAELPPARSRLFGDVDIMVRSQCLQEVESALFGAGWMPQERDAYNDRYYRQWMHELPPLVHATRDSTLDVHHTITPPTSRFRVDAQMLFAQLRPIGDSGRLFVLAPTDMILHSAVHLFQEGEFQNGMRDLLDIGDLLRHFGNLPGFCLQLSVRATELGLERPLYYALSTSEMLFPGSVPPELTHLIAKHQPGRLLRFGMAALFSRALRPDHPSCDDVQTRAARSLLYLRAHALRMPIHLLLPHLARKAYMRRFPAKRSDARHP